MGPVREPNRFGNHEANATIRYVEVYEIQPDPGEEDDFPIPYQPVQVKCLRFEGYVAAAVAIETANADITIRTRKSGKKHGTRGNSIDVAFDIDSGITPTAEAAFDEPTDVLTIKVKTSSTTWEDVSAAVAGVLSGAFILEASNPTATVGAAIESETGTLSGGVDGAYETYGNAFGIGDHDTADDVETGNRFWIVWRADPQRWEILTGGATGRTQLAQIIDVAVAGTSPHYPSTTGLSFLLPEDLAHAVIVGAVLLDTILDGALLEVVNPTDEITLGALRIVAFDVRKEGIPAVGDIVRVWTSDGVPAVPGESDYADGAFNGQHAIYCEPINAVEELRGLPTWVLAEDQVLVHAADTKELEWMEAEAFVGGPGGGGGGGGDTVVPGYAIDTSGTGTVTVGFDPTEITGFATTANTLQFFQHLAADTGPTDPAWKTVTDYDATKNQMWWHKSGSFVFETTTNYGGSATEPQLLVNWGAGNGGEWQWKSAGSYDDSDSTQLLGHVNGTWQWKTLKDWLDGHLTIHLSIVSDTLKVELKVDGASISNSTVDITDCTDF